MTAEREVEIRAQLNLRGVVHGDISMSGNDPVRYTHPLFAMLAATLDALAAAQAQAVTAEGLLACTEVERDEERLAVATARTALVAGLELAAEWERLGGGVPLRHEAGYPGYPTLESATAETYRECAVDLRAALTGAGAESGGDTPDAPP